MNYEVKRNTNERRFEAVIDNDVIGIVEYIESDNETLTITHTGVNAKYEGMGIAANLNKSLLEYAMKHNYKIIPLCSYSKMYIDRHPQFAKLLKSHNK